MNIEDIKVGKYFFISTDLNIIEIEVTKSTPASVCAYIITNYGGYRIYASNGTSFTTAQILDGTKEYIGDISLRYFDKSYDGITAKLKVLVKDSESTLKKKQALYLKRVESLQKKLDVLTQEPSVITIEEVQKVKLLREQEEIDKKIKALQSQRIQVDRQLGKVVK